ELTSFARWLVGSALEADELVQEVVLRALENAASIDEPSRLKAWLFRTARNARVDLFRSGAARSRLMVLDGGLEDLEETSVPADPMPAIVDRVDVEKALAKLPEIARAVVLLADLWQFSYEEVATILDIPVGTVRSRLARARARLAQLLFTDAASRAAGGEST
ncbi:MAG: RNA polymerase sigma factor, partial [Polyangiaceae bacterium]